MVPEESPAHRKHERLHTRSLVGLMKWCDSAERCQAAHQGTSTWLCITLSPKIIRRASNSFIYAVPAQKRGESRHLAPHAKLSRRNSRRKHRGIKAHVNWNQKMKTYFLTTEAEFWSMALHRALKALALYLLLNVSPDSRS